MPSTLFKDWEGLLGVSYGGGVNSAALIVGLKEQGVQPDYIVFADTAGTDPQRRGEKPETYDYIDGVFRPWVDANFECGLTVVGHWRDSLRESCLRNGSLPSKAYGFAGCSVKFKRQIMERYEKQRFAPDQIITKAIGIHAGETKRGNIPDEGRYRYRYFLREWGWGQQDCVDALTRNGLTVPMKSACYYCPSSKPHEIIWLRDNHPDLFEDALVMERASEAYHQKELLPDGTPRTKGLGRKFSWSQFVNITPAGVESIPEPDDIPCMCDDGGGSEE